MAAADQARAREPAVVDLNPEAKELNQAFVPGHLDHRAWLAEYPASRLSAANEIPLVRTLLVEESYSGLITTLSAIFPKIVRCPVGLTPSSPCTIDKRVMMRGSGN